MIDEQQIEPSPSPSLSSSSPTLLLHPRREPFEYGLLPIPKLVFTDGTATLSSLKQKLLISGGNRVTSLAISDALQISADQSRLLLDVLASVHHNESDPSVKPGGDGESADVYDLILFLYVQSYKRLLIRTHKDSASVADVWPSTSAFDGYLSILSPLRLVRSNSRRFMPSQSDEETHQLSYLQKHLHNILSLLSEPVEGEGEESLVLTMERFEHLGFIIQFGDKGSECVPLSQAAPFFANSDPDMPAVPVPASQVHDWLLEHISSALEHISERSSQKDNGTSVSDQDVPMIDACTSSIKASPCDRSPCVIDGISKSSVLKQASDLKNPCVKIINCNDSVIYVLAPLNYATIYGCSDATIVLGAVGKAVRVEHCERVHVITAAKRICIANCRECVFFLGVNQRPLIVGDNHKLQVAPYNTFYPQLVEHMRQVGIESTINKWDEPLTLGIIDPHDSLSHSAGGADVQAESATHIDPDQFTDFLIYSVFRKCIAGKDGEASSSSTNLVGNNINNNKQRMNSSARDVIRKYLKKIPKWCTSESPDSTKHNPFHLPGAYMTSHQTNIKNLVETKQLLKEAPLEDSKKKEVSAALHVYFKDWLYASGNIRQLYGPHGE